MPQRWGRVGECANGKNPASAGIIYASILRTIVIKKNRAKYYRVAVKRKIKN
jgi:hypothetical protein